jgi:hypothetical protein
MRIVALALAALVAVAPTAAACACPPIPSSRRMACEGTARCCCDDAAKKAPLQDGCPRSSPVVGSFEAPPGAFDVLGHDHVLAILPLTLPFVEPASSQKEAGEDGLTRASPSRLRHLLFSILLI